VNGHGSGVLFLIKARGAGAQTPVRVAYEVTSTANAACSASVRILIRSPNARTIERMSDNEVTTIQIIKGQDAGGARRAGLSTAQRTGQACVVCQGTEDLNQHIGWVDGVSVKVHSWHLENYRLGETLPPPTTAS